MKSSTLRIAYVVLDYPLASELFIQREVQSLRGFGVQIEVARMRGKGTLLGMARAFLGSPRRGWCTLREAWRLRRSLPRPLAFLRRFAQAMHLTEQLAPFGPDLVHAHFSNAPAATARLVACWFGRPWGASAHAQDVFADNYGFAERLSTARYVVACSETAAAKAKNLLLPSAGPVVHRVYHGVAVTTVRTVWQAERTIAAAGRFVAKKGFGVLIDAVALLHRRGTSARARIIGVGSEEAMLRAKIAEYGLEQWVSLEPWRSHEELRAILQLAAVVAIPSVVQPDGDRDNIPNVLVEALALGVPVVATRLESVAELGDVLLTVAEGDSRQLADALEAVLNDSTLARRLSGAGPIAVRRLFDPTANALQMLQIFAAHAGPAARLALSGNI